MKRELALLFCFLAIVSCASIPPSQIASENAKTWVGAHFDDAVIMMGPPNAKQDLSSGGAVVMWQGTETYQSGGVPTIAPSIGFGSTGQYIGSSYSITHTPATTLTDQCKLIMAIEPSGIITSSRSQGGCEVPKFMGSRRAVYHQPAINSQPVKSNPIIAPNKVIEQSAVDGAQTQQLSARAAPTNPLNYVKGKWKLTFYSESGRCDSRWTSTMEFLGTREGIRRYRGGSVVVRVLDDGQIKLKHGGNAYSEYKIFDGYLSPNGYGEGKWRLEALYAETFCRGRWEARKVESY